MKFAGIFGVQAASQFVWSSRIFSLLIFNDQSRENLRTPKLLTPNGIRFGLFSF